MPLARVSVPQGRRTTASNRPQRALMIRLQNAPDIFIRDFSFATTRQWWCHVYAKNYGSSGISGGNFIERKQR
jgi:hypothetical protein